MKYKKQNLCDTCKNKYPNCDPDFIKWNNTSESIKGIVVYCTSYQKQPDAIDIQAKAFGG